MAISHRWRSLLVWSVLAFALSLAARTLVGPPGAVVHVRWQEAVDQATRRSIEGRFHLERGTPEDGRTWRYDLRDTSSANIRSLVNDPAVADTHHLDRRALTLSADAERTSRPERFPIPNAVAFRIADIAALLCALLAIVSVVGGTPTRLRRGVATGSGALTQLLARWVPELDARALGAFRVALGIGLAWVALSRDLTPLPLELQRHRALVDLDVVHSLAASASACTAIEMALLATAILFAAGVWARISYAAFVAAFALSTLVTLERTSAHDLGLPLITFLGWLTVPWSARQDSAPQRAYGFAIWWPGLTLGVALLAAAYWKLHQSGLEWVTGGAVKYHFIADSANAAVDWGLRAASNPALAVVLSLGAIVAEAAFIANIAARGPWTRLAFGLCGAGLFAALYLFQGIYWPAWTVLFLAFLPWSLANATPEAGVAQVPGATDIARAPAPALRLRTAQALVVVMLIAAQAYASASGTEAEPLMSHFPMYAHNYASIEDFENSMRPRMTRVVAVHADGKDIGDLLPVLVDNDRLLLMELAEHPSGPAGVLSERERRDRELLCERYQQATGTLPAAITFTIERKAFDWTSGRFREYAPVDTAPVPLAALCRHLADPQVTG